MGEARKSKRICKRDSPQQYYSSVVCLAPEGAVFLSLQESAKVCAQRTKSLEKAFDDLLQTHSQRDALAALASSPSSTATSASAATTGAADAAV